MTGRCPPSLPCGRRQVQDAHLLHGGTLPERVIRHPEGQGGKQLPSETVASEGHGCKRRRRPGKFSFNCSARTTLIHALMVSRDDVVELAGVAASVGSQHPCIS